MFLIYFGFYILFLLVMWGFFGVAWIHAHKFKNFSNHIVFVTRLLLIFLIILSLTGAIILYSLINSGNTFSVDLKTTQIENQNYY